MGGEARPGSGLRFTAFRGGQWWGGGAVQPDDLEKPRYGCKLTGQPGEGSCQSPFPSPLSPLLSQHSKPSSTSVYQAHRLASPFPLLSPGDLAPGPKCLFSCVSLDVTCTSSPLPPSKPKPFLAYTASLFLLVPSLGTPAQRAGPCPIHRVDNVRVLWNMRTGWAHCGGSG